MTNANQPVAESDTTTLASGSQHQHDLEKDLGPAAASMQLRRRPWQPYVTPWEHIVSHHYSGSGTESDPYLVSWVKDDAENPMTWAPWRKWFIAMSVAMTTFIVAYASSAYSGAIGSIQADFPGYKQQVYILGVSAFVLGFAFGPLLWAPLSEIYGRRNLFILSYVGFTAFNGGVVAAQNIWTIIILRFFAGLVGSSPLTNAGGTISDMFSAEQRGLGMAVFASAPFLGPAVGPITAGFLSEATGWRWVCGLIAILTAVFLVHGFIFIPETYAPVLLQQRADRLSQATGKVYRTVLQKDGKKKPAELFKVALSRPWQLLFKEPICLLLALYCAIIYGTLYLLFAAFPIVYQRERGWSPGIGGLSFIGLLIGLMSALLYMVFYENPRYVKVSRQHNGFAPPESRLPPAILGGILLPIGMFWFAWTASPASIHWSVSIIACIPFGFGICLSFLAVISYLIDAYLLYAVSALAANAVLRSLFGFAFPLFTPNMYENLGVNWASSIPAFLALACVPMPIAFYRYGHLIRAKGPYAAQAAKLWKSMQQTSDDDAVEEKVAQHHGSSDKAVDNDANERAKTSAQ